jgi:hypothetical protein
VDVLALRVLAGLGQRARDRTTLAPATEEAAAIVSRMRELGVLVGTDGPFRNVVKVRGPLSLTRRDANLVVAALATAIREQWVAATDFLLRPLRPDSPTSAPAISPEDDGR